MGTVNHLYDPNQEVYVIQSCEDYKSIKVASGKVIRVRIESLVTETTIEYDIRLTGGGSGTHEFVEEDVFLDKASAMIEYDLRVE